MDGSGEGESISVLVKSVLLGRRAPKEREQTGPL